MRVPEVPLHQWLPLHLSVLLVPLDRLRLPVLLGRSHLLVPLGLLVPEVLPAR